MRIFKDNLEPSFFLKVNLLFYGEFHSEGYFNFIIIYVHLNLQQNSTYVEKIDDT